MNQVITFPDASDPPGDRWLRAGDEANSIGSRALPPLLQYWQAVVRWRLLIVGIIAACLAIGIVITMLQAPLYNASSQIEINRQEKNITNVEGLESSRNPYDMEFYNSQYALLRSESLAERVVRKLKLANDAGFLAAHGIDLNANSDTTASNSASRQTQRERTAASLLLGNLRIDPIRSSSLVNISYRSRSPVWSERIANAWPQEFIAASIDRQFASTADARKYLEDRLENLRSRLQQSEQDLINFGSDHNIVALGSVRDSTGKTSESRTLAASNLEALNAALNAARTDRIAAESRASSRGSDASTEAITNTAIGNLRSKREEVAAEYAKMLVQFEPGYPAARALKSQIDTLDSAIARETARIGRNRVSGYDEALKRERELAAQVQALKAQFDREQRATVQYNIYQREVDTNRQLYDALLQRYKEIGIAGSVGVTNIAIVDRAKEPRSPSSPSLPFNLGLALLAGLVVSFAAIVGLEQIDEGIRHPEDVEKLLEVPLLGNVPLVSGDRLEALTDPKSPISEAYQSIRAALSFATDHGLPRSLIVTSSQAHEGKSLSSLALAVAMCRTGRKVLLIDGDMRSPSMHHMTGCSNAKGLSNLLAGEGDFAATIVGTHVADLSVMPAGPMPPNPADLLSSDRLSGLVESLKGRFDCIVIDCPPVLGLADAPLLSTAVEGCIFVIQAERVPVRGIRSSLERLRRANGRMFGAIVTMVDYSRHRFGYGYGYGYSYEYRYGKKSAKA